MVRARALRRHERGWPRERKRLDLTAQSSEATYHGPVTDRTGALRLGVEQRVFTGLEERVKPYVEDATLRERRRREAVAELLREYEAEHGVITEDELRQLDSEWLT